MHNGLLDSSVHFEVFTNVKNNILSLIFKSEVLIFNAVYPEAYLSFYKKILSTGIKNIKCKILNVNFGPWN